MNEDLSQLWMIPYADLMSTLVLLFMSLFAYSYSEHPPEYDQALAHMEQQLADRRIVIMDQQQAGAGPASN